MTRIEVAKIADGLYVIPVGPVNTFLLESSDGCALIDTGIPGSVAAILRALHALGKQPRDVRHIILTHAHPDHIGSLAPLKKITGAEVYIHALDAGIATNGAGFRPMTPAPGLFPTMMFQMFVRPVETVQPATIEHHVQTEGAIAGGLTAIHVPGHCAGQLALFWPRHGGVLFAADTCMNLMGLGWAMGYEDLEEGKRSLNKLAQLDFRVACFGHGQTILHDAGDRLREMCVRLSVTSKVTQTSSIQSWENAVRDAGLRGATPATVVAPASLQRSNLQMFLRSMAENPRHK